jgi:hypothetical protein
MDLFDALSRTPALLARVAASLPDAVSFVRSGPFAFVEHAWHIADLEREAFGVRIARLLAEDDPLLPDFDGERAARERAYLDRGVSEAVALFAAARAANQRRFGALSGPQWSRCGRQEGVGPITLGDLPRRMLDHDFAHFNEIADLLADVVPGHPMIVELREVAASGPKSSRAA